jgi:hypothetical protein
MCDVCIGFHIHLNLHLWLIQQLVLVFGISMRNLLLWSQSETTKPSKFQFLFKISLADIYFQFLYSIQFIKEMKVLTPASTEALKVEKQCFAM